MPTLSSSGKSGNTSVSSLLRTSTTLASELSTFKDAEAAQNFSLSAKTADDLAVYKDYLNGRIDKLSLSNSITDATKVIGLQNTLFSAIKANGSADIQRENIQIMSGNATLQDKYNLIVGQFGRAINIGDMSLAQNLESQAYSVSQQIQYKAQLAAEAAVTNAKAVGAATGTNWAKTATTLEAKLVDFNNQYVHAGQKSANKILGDFVNSKVDPSNPNSPTVKESLATLGIVLKDGVAPNYFDVVSGVNHAVFNSYNNAGLAVSTTAADGGKSYFDKAAGVVDKIPTAFGTMNAIELAHAADNPNQFTYNESPDFVGQKSGGPGGQQNPQVGYNFDLQHGVTPTIAQTPWITVPPTFNNQLNALGLHVVGNKMGAGNAYTVAVGKNAPDYIKNVLPGNATTQVVITEPTAEFPQGRLQFEADSVSSDGKAVYTLAKGKDGNMQLFESSNLGDKLLNSSPTISISSGSKTPDISVSGRGSFKDNKLDGKLGGVFGGVGVFGSPAQNLITNAQLTQTRIQAETAAAAKAMIAQAPPPLANISIAPPPPPPSVSQPAPKANYPVAPTYPVAPKTVNPQQPNVTPQGGNINIQGGNINLLNSSGGIKI